MRRLTIVLTSLSALIIAAVVGYWIFIVADADESKRYKNVSHAMDSTLLDGEVFTLQQVDASRGQLGRGTVVTHRWPEDRRKQFIKRIVGVPGDTLSMVNGVLHVNHRTVREPYAWHSDPTIDPVTEDFRWQRHYLVASVDTAHYTASRNNWGPIVVPMGDYFVLGDNRDNSLDSRWWGFLPSGDVTGIVRRVFTSSDSLGRVRWGRLGHLVR